MALETIHRIELGDISVREVQARGAAVVRTHQHRTASLTIIRSGIVTDRAGDATEVLQSGDVLFRPGGTRHENRIEEPGSRGAIIEISEGFLLPFIAHRRGAFRMTNDELRGTPFELIEQLSTTDAVAPLLIRALITEILAHAARTAPPNDPPPEWLRRVIEEIDAHYADALSLERAAFAAGVPAVRVRRALRRHYGRTFAQMLRERRIAAALALLETGASLRDIALECGFYDQAHFTRAFERVRGISPHRYRSRVTEPF